MKKLITESQMEWLMYRKIEANKTYMFPRWGFTMYASPSYSNGAHLDTNPFTRSLDSERFFVKEITNGFCKGNFADNPKAPDFYILQSELECRDFIEVFFLKLFCFLPMVIYNKIKRKNP